MKTKIAIDKARLDTGEPAIIIQTGHEVQRAHEIIINGPCKVTGVASGKERFGGARVWIETYSQVDILGK